MMNTYLTTPVIAPSQHSSNTVVASTVTMTSMNSVKVHATPQAIQTTKVVGNVVSSIGLGPSLATTSTTNSTPTVNIAIKRARVNSKDKELKKQTSTEIVQSSGGTIIVKREISLDSDLRNMMHAFGDCCSPLEESIRLMESILKQELQGFVVICDSIATLSGTKSLALFEPIYAIRNERQRLIRLLKYFATKDQQLKLQRLNQMSPAQGQAPPPPPTKFYLDEIRQILERLDESGEYSRLLDPEQMAEPTKTEKALRADKLSQKMTYPKYFTYSKARSVSFARKIGNLHDWVQANTRSEYKMSNSFLDVLSFLAYEIVSEMVDLAFVVRRERVPTTNPIVRISDTRVTNPETCMSAPAFQKRKDDQCNSVSEILVQASELEAKRLKKATTTNKEVQLPKNMFALTASEIGEGYNRFQSTQPRCVPPPLSYKVRADRLRRMNYQY